MKKVFVLFLLLVNISFSLKVISVEPIDFGSVIKGENSKLEGVKIEVRGSSGKKVKIDVPKKYVLDGNIMEISAKEDTIYLGKDGKGSFELDIELEVKETEDYKTLTDSIDIKVLYAK